MLPGTPSPVPRNKPAKESLDQTNPLPRRAEGADGEPCFSPADHPGELGRLGRYRVLRKIGQGGMGAVYLGFDSGLQRKVALKVMLPESAANRSVRERFLREA